jgi:hypothetical protein
LSDSFLFPPAVGIHAKGWFNSKIRAKISAVNKNASRCTKILENF